MVIWRGAPLPSIVFLNRFYWPDESATSQLLTDLAEDLAGRQWRVSVITSDADYRNPAVRLPARETRNGVRIERVRTTHSGRLRLTGRALDAALYLAGAFVRLLGSRHDVAVALTDPPMLIVPTVLAARARGMRCVCWSQDVFPDIAIALGVLRARMLSRMLSALARRALAACDRVVALGERMAERIVAGGVELERVEVIHNWTQVDAIRPIAPRDNAVARRLDVAGKFVILYSGNAGRAHTFDAVITAARKLRDDPAVVFLFVGGGPQLPALRAAAKDLQNVRFASHVPRGELAESLSVGSASLVTERREVTGLIVPSKTYGILASGRPVLYVGDPDSDVAALVRRHDCGAVLDLDDADGLVEVIRRWRSAPHEVEALGARARKASVQYDVRVATSKWDAVLKGVLSG